MFAVIFETNMQVYRELCDNKGVCSSSHLVRTVSTLLRTAGQLDSLTSFCWSSLRCGCVGKSCAALVSSTWWGHSFTSMNIVFSPTPVSMAVLKYSDLDKSFTTNTFHRVLSWPAPQNERVRLDDLPLAFEGKVTLSCPKLGHLSNEEWVGSAHSGLKYGLDALHKQAL